MRNSCRNSGATERWRAGLTLAETTIAIFISALVLLGIGIALKRSGRAAELLAAGSAASLEAGALAGHILRTGRLAASCETPASGELLCRVDKGVPPSGVLTGVRFRIAGGNALYEEDNGGTWATKMVFHGVTELVVCDDAAMGGGACDAAGILPAALSARHVANLAAPPPWRSPPGRFFRFRLRAGAPAGGREARRLQSAFFVRNPSPGSSLAYQWGTKADK